MLFPTGYILYTKEQNTFRFMHPEHFLTCSIMFSIYIPNSNICIAMLLISEYDILSGFLPHFRIFPCILKEKYPKISINYTYVPWKTKYCTWAANRIYLLQFKGGKTLLFFHVYDIRSFSIQMFGTWVTPQYSNVMLRIYFEFTQQLRSDFLTYKN